MLRLFALIYALVGPTLAGVFITAALTMNRVDARAMIVAAAAGFGIALPAAWVVAKRLSANG